MKRENPLATIFEQIQKEFGCVAQNGYVSMGICKSKAELCVIQAPVPIYMLYAPDLFKKTGDGKAESLLFTLNNPAVSSEDVYLEDCGGIMPEDVYFVLDHEDRIHVCFATEKFSNRGCLPVTEFDPRTTVSAIKKELYPYFDKVKLAA